VDVGQPAAERRPERGPRRRSAALATARRAVTRFQDDDLGDRAAALTYYAMLSLFPGLIVLVALLGLLGQYPRTTNALLDIVGELAPSSTVASLRGPIEGIVRNKGGAGALLGVGLTASMWSASGYVGALTRALNAIQHLDERRPFWKRRPLQLVITVAMVIALALSAVALVLTGPLAHAVGRRVGLGDAAVTAWGIGKWPLLVLLALVVVGALYRLVPDRSGGRPRWQVRTELRPGSDGPAVVGQIMSRRVRVASADRSLADVVPIFSETGHHHIPVIGADGALVGILTQTDVVRALRRFAEPVPSA